MYYESFNRYFVSSFSKGVNVVLINSTHFKKESLIFKVRNFIQNTFIWVALTHFQVRLAVRPFFLHISESMGHNHAASQFSSTHSIITFSILKSRGKSKSHQFFLIVCHKLFPLT